MLKILGRANLMQYILPCIDSLINNNSNEMKIIEIIKAIIKFIDMGYLYPKEACSLFYKLSQFLLHPNVNIRFYLIELLKNILSKISNEDAYIYLYDSIKKYTDIPIIDMKIDYIKESLIKNISRVIYQLELKKERFLKINMVQLLSLLEVVILQVVQNQ